MPFDTNPLATRQTPPEFDCTSATPARVRETSKSEKANEAANDAANGASRRDAAMAARAPGRRNFLPRRGTLVLDNREGIIIEVDGGSLWVTMERDPRDVILVTGMRFEIDRSGRTVIAAEEDSHFRLLGEPSPMTSFFGWVASRAARVVERASPRLERDRVPYF